MFLLAVIIVILCKEEKKTLLIITILTNHLCRKWVKDSRSDVKLHNHSLTLMFWFWTHSNKHKLNTLHLFFVNFLLLFPVCFLESLLCVNFCLWVKSFLLLFFSPLNSFFNIFFSLKFEDVLLDLFFSFFFGLNFPRRLFSKILLVAGFFLLWKSLRSHNYCLFQK